MCVINERTHSYDIKSHKDSLLIIEMNCYYKDLLDRPKMDVFGWSVVELFDMNLDLMRGKWKIPFYDTDIKPNDLVS